MKVEKVEENESLVKKKSVWWLKKKSACGRILKAWNKWRRNRFWKEERKREKERWYYQIWEGGMRMMEKNKKIIIIQFYEKDEQIQFSAKLSLLLCTCQLPFFEVDNENHVYYCN